MGVGFDIVMGGVFGFSLTQNARFFSKKCWKESTVSFVFELLSSLVGCDTTRLLDVQKARDYMTHLVKAVNNDEESQYYIAVTLNMVYW
jgi:hypothetical protein